ncbi:hypothetical protein Dform_00464 [Dehalogenimonas formicexedens]|uniref:Schlafen group 3-like DNA/RNA helicase domain-containing protein n=1 Tax=Dehalogenimonas formicexedens TaxID=1839801 RepID=A0A1P8F5W1_9CHLR|nr:hypothetical protein Dform_00464 [Dehalogenimonas formicexedens]
MFEYSIPRMGKRIDVVILIKHVIFVLEFKVGEIEFKSKDIDQVYDYALDLKNFHEPSHDQFIVPILIATKAKVSSPCSPIPPAYDKIFSPINSDLKSLEGIMKQILDLSTGKLIDPKVWKEGRYCPTPTIIEAALALYNGHSVEDISRSDANAINLSTTSDKITKIIQISKEKHQKSICFVTGVPGAGKTLVGLNIANKHSDESNDLYSVFLSGNGPLVQVLREAITRDKVRQEKERGLKITKGAVMRTVKVRIQNVHNFRDDCLLRPGPPVEHVAIFDEAQRAWDLDQTQKFMKQKKGHPNFKKSEPEFLISCLDRHSDWAVVICLVGGGQEINTGEAGIGEWVDSLDRSFPDWKIYISSKLTDSEYCTERELSKIKFRDNVQYDDDLHLSVSMRSFRAENVSFLIKKLLDLKPDESREALAKVIKNYPIVITRDLSIAKNWLRTHARGSERYGIVVSSQAERLKPYAIDIKSPMDPVHWFLEGKEDVRSSYYLEDVATEFHVQGLELDWVCVTWDADFRYSKTCWEHRSFIGSRWYHIKMSKRMNYLKNAYRVLLTRARQGMVVVVPKGEIADPTRQPDFYDPTYQYLKDIGFQTI